MGPPTGICGEAVLTLASPVAELRAHIPCSPARVRSWEPEAAHRAEGAHGAGWAAMWAARAVGPAPPTPGDLHSQSERGQLPLPGRMGSVAEVALSWLATTPLGPCRSKRKSWPTHVLCVPSPGRASRNNPTRSVLLLSPLYSYRK